MKQPDISSLAVISDRHTCALLDKDGTISWYCPGAFDRAAVLSSLIDEQKGGYWQMGCERQAFVKRRFIGRSSVLQTYFHVEEEILELTDLMPVGMNFRGICRKISAAPDTVFGELRLAADYGSDSVTLESISPFIIELPTEGMWLHCSHPLQLKGETINFQIPTGDPSWIALIDSPVFDEDILEDALRTTLRGWERIAEHIDHHGPFQEQVQNSLRALQQMVYEPTGGIIAAPTTGLPEVIGGERNYDYRFVWMRDAALITSSLVGLKTDGQVERAFMSFVSGAMKKNDRSHVSCFYSIDGSIVKNNRNLPLAGYKQSRPLMEGNTAADQFQLDAEASILLACGAIYAKTGERPEWETVEAIADLICKNWERKDNGIWEEEQVQHYTSSKALAARALEVMAPYQENKETADRWLHNAGLIRNFIKENCLTSYGAYAVHAGSEDVDIACALFAPFGFDNANSNYMQKTVAAIEEHYCDNGLYRRHLLEFDSQKEGVFLAASCWMAHHYALAGNVTKARSILECVQGCANDLGYLSEEFDMNDHTMLGNFPQTFVHSSFICAVNGLTDSAQ
ncbi:glycoside hydrolase family 15 protein [Mucilaginibacter daejeonensis]|uniref:glycoside hydrolase family 15 protein n=1 Tax=Mucilaginibacter daejeonensis TaxID=398049 RepID=UPI001D173306|nr:glycoside hydrolase family 15 protein [Mucilaginibacter daejeonensis]UEG54197.1 glycoside hydrolase family 15 protein [Mucilaginibacter daejeonensis]